ncbi:hypothetical protein SAMN05216337_105427 [Bradyrhizobium brasilense]|uniref:Uncharacterized protein n=1 Tax=Bradyrhizobium brasilense TaxID=1419277 RepID=A0A1G7KT56_9BRAD|nr:hypothetical protein SAMN05216337_105427 [Bradyrhizobium brasilense]
MINCRLILVAFCFGFASAAIAAERPTIPAPAQATKGRCVRYDHLPPVCPYRVYLTPEQRKAIEQMHQENVQKLNSVK